MRMPHQPSTPRGKRVLVLALLLGTAVGGWWFLQAPANLRPIPIPPDLARMEPQLKAYLQQEVALLDKSPGQATSQARIGLVFAANQLWPQAMAAFQNAQELDRKNPLPVLYQGIALEETGALAAARERYEATLALDPHFPPGQGRLGDVALRLGDVDTARKAFGQLVRLAPTEWRGPAGLGQCAIQSGTPAAAIEPLQRALQLAPRSKVVHHLLGVALRATGRQKEAEFHLRRGVDGLHVAIPDAWSAEIPRHIRLPQDLAEAARSALQEGRVQDAANLLTQALSFRPNSTTLHINLAEVMIQAGQAERAMTLLDRAAALEPNRQSLAITRAAALLELKRPADALNEAEKAVAAAPGTPQPHLVRSLALQALERPAEALKSMERARDADPRNALIEVEIGDLLWHSLKSAEQALLHYKIALEIEPDSLDAHARVVEVAAQLRLQEPAQSSLQALRSLEPNHPEVQRLGEIVEREFGKSPR